MKLSDFEKLIDKYPFTFEQKIKVSGRVNEMKKDFFDRFKYVHAKDIQQFFKQEKKNIIRNLERLKRQFETGKLEN